MCICVHVCMHGCKAGKVTQWDKVPVESRGQECGRKYCETVFPSTLSNLEYPFLAVYIVNTEVEPHT